MAIRQPLRETSTANRVKGNVMATKMAMRPKQQSAIQGFGRISKPQSAIQKAKNRKTNDRLIATAFEQRELEVRITHESKKSPKEEKATPQIKTSRKRTRAARDAEQSSDDESQTKTTSRACQNKKRAAIGSAGLPTPAPTPESTDSNCADFLAGLTLSSAKRPGRLISPGTSNAHSVSPSPISPRSQPKGRFSLADEDLGECVHDLLNLYSSFLTALLMHYAHKGRLTPADLRELLPSITNSWGKRQVSLVDVQRCIAIPGKPSGRNPSFKLLDYGQGRVFLETDWSTSQGASQDDKTAGYFANGTLDDASLKAQFRERVVSLWRDWQKTSTESDSAASSDVFVASLSVQGIAESTSLTKIRPSLTKGQSRLQSLSDLIAAREHREATRCLPSGPPVAQSSSISIAQPRKPSLQSPITLPSPQAIQTQTNRKQNLLDRLFAKQQAASISSSSSASSAASAARRSALHRAEEVLNVLNLLAASNSSTTSITVSSGGIGGGIGGLSPLVGRTGGAGRATFSMTELCRRVQDSLRHRYISVEEAGACVELLAREVAPGFVRESAFGGGLGGAREVKVVVIDMGLRPALGVVRERVKRALEGDLMES